MNESAGKGERDAAPSGIVIGPGEGRTILGTDAITLIATVEETGGSIGVFEDSSSPGDGPPRHVHHGSDELFYLLEGEFLILVGERQERVSAGTYVFVPRGTVHAYKVIGTERGRVLSAFVPGGPELAFEEFVKLRTERTPKQECGADERDVRGAKREVRLRVRGTTTVGLFRPLELPRPPTRRSSQNLSSTHSGE
jgi:quercetin dioxygenase-like cupin family protein